VESISRRRVCRCAQSRHVVRPSLSTWYHVVQQGRHCGNIYQRARSYSRVFNSAAAGQKASTGLNFSVAMAGAASYVEAARSAQGKIHVRKFLPREQSCRAMNAVRTAGDVLGSPDQYSCPLIGFSRSILLRILRPYACSRMKPLSGRAGACRVEHVTEAVTLRFRL